MESDGKIRRSNRSKIKQVEIIEVKDEPESEDDEQYIEMELILPDLEEQDPLRIDDKEREELLKNPIKQQCTGYMLWCAGRRKELLKTEPQTNFCELSKRLGQEWEKISETKKCMYRRRAERLNNEPRRQSSRQRKPKEIEDLSQFEKKKYKKKTEKEVRKMENNFQIKKSKFRYTAYSLWAQEARVVLLNDRPEMSFVEMSKQLSEMWKSVSNLEKYNYRRRAKRLTNHITNTRSDDDGTVKEKVEKVIGVSSKGRVMSKPTKLLDFCKLEYKQPTRKSSKVKAEPSVMKSKPEAENGSEINDKEPTTDPSIEDKDEESRKSKSENKKSLNQDPTINTLIESGEDTNVS